MPRAAATLPPSDSIPPPPASGPVMRAAPRPQRTTLPYLPERASDENDEPESKRLQSGTRIKAPAEPARDGRYTFIRGRRTG